MTENTVKMTKVLNAVGTGLHDAKVYYLNFEFFNFSILSLIAYFSSSDMSIYLFFQKLIKK